MTPEPMYPAGGTTIAPNVRPPSVLVEDNPTPPWENNPTHRPARKAGESQRDFARRWIMTGARLSANRMAKEMNAHISVPAKVLLEMLDEGYEFDVQKEGRESVYQLLSTEPNPALVGQRKKRNRKSSAKTTPAKSTEAPKAEAVPEEIKIVYPALDENLVVRGLLREGKDAVLVLTNGKRSWTVVVTGQTA